jgi:hypothetical protein
VRGLLLEHAQARHEEVVRPLLVLHTRTAQRCKHDSVTHSAQHDTGKK